MMSRRRYRRGFSPFSFGFSFSSEVRAIAPFCLWRIGIWRPTVLTFFFARLFLDFMRREFSAKPLLPSRSSLLLTPFFFALVFLFEDSSPVESSLFVISSLGRFLPMTCCLSFFFRPSLRLFWVSASFSFLLFLLLYSSQDSYLPPNVVRPPRVRTPPPPRSDEVYYLAFPFPVPLLDYLFPLIGFCFGF